MSETLPNATLDAALAEAREAYVARNPASLAAHVEATASLPGGNTRTVLFHGPFPLLMARGEGCRLWDAQTRKKLDKDRFRQGLGGVVEAYEEVAGRLGVDLTTAA